MLEETHDREEIIQRVAALDIGKAELVCCVRAGHPDTTDQLRVADLQGRDPLDDLLTVVSLGKPPASPSDGSTGWLPAGATRTWGS